MGTVPKDVKRLLNDCEMFLDTVLQEENLTNDALKMRDILLSNFTVVYNQNPLEFTFRSESREEDGSDDNQSSSLGRSDDASVASDYQDEVSPQWEILPVAAQDLSNVLKQGHLEKRRRDHSFFGSEWQKRWCVLNNSTLYYFGSEKDKQQKGAFYVHGYTVAQVRNLRKEKQKMSCFELSAPGRRTYQFTASNPQEAKDWVDQINFILKDLQSGLIPFDVDEDEEEEEEDKEEEEGEGEGTYDDIDGVAVGGGRDEEEDDEDAIYEMLPAWSLDYSNFYQGLWDCEGDQPDELNFSRGDLIYILSKEFNILGWWVGELKGAVGIVPKDFLHPAYIL
ncbi:unnamed protein product [Lota lota]